MTADILFTKDVEMIQCRDERVYFGYHIRLFMSGSIYEKISMNKFFFFFKKNTWIDVNILNCLVISVLGANMDEIFLMNVIMITYEADAIADRLPEVEKVNKLIAL